MDSSDETPPELTPEQYWLRLTAAILQTFPFGPERDAERLRLRAAHEEALADRKAIAELTGTPQERLNAARAIFSRESHRLTLDHGLNADVDAMLAAQTAYYDAKEVAAKADAEPEPTVPNMPHLTSDQKRQYIEHLLDEDSSRSDRAIGRLVGCDNKTVGVVRQQLAARESWRRSHEETIEPTDADREEAEETGQPVEDVARERRRRELVAELNPGRGSFRSYNAVMLDNENIDRLDAIVSEEGRSRNEVVGDLLDLYESRQRTREQRRARRG